MEFLYFVKVNIDFNTSKSWLYIGVIKLNVYININYKFLS